MHKIFWQYYFTVYLTAGFSIGIHLAARVSDSTNMKVIRKLFVVMSVFGHPSPLVRDLQCVCVSLGFAALLRLLVNFFRVVRHIGNLLHLTKTQACMRQAGYWGEISKHFSATSETNINIMEAVKAFNGEVCLNFRRDFECNRCL